MQAEAARVQLLTAQHGLVYIMGTSLHLLPLAAENRTQHKNKWRISNSKVQQQPQQQLQQSVNNSRQCANWRKWCLIWVLAFIYKQNWAKDRDWDAVYELVRRGNCACYVAYIAHLRLTWWALHAIIFLLANLRIVEIRNECEVKTVFVKKKWCCNRMLIILLLNPYPCVDAYYSLCRLVPVDNSLKKNEVWSTVCACTNTKNHSYRIRIKVADLCHSFVSPCAVHLLHPALFNKVSHTEQVKTWKYHEMSFRAHPNSHHFLISKFLFICVAEKKLL